VSTRSGRPFGARPGLRREKVTRRWLWSIVALLCLLLLDAILVLVASGFYDSGDKEGFASVFATGVLLNGAAVAILGVILTVALSIVSDIRTQREAEAHKRAELFARIRDAHLRVVLAQQILRAAAQDDDKTYEEQMRILLEVDKDMGEIRQEITVSGDLYEDIDRRLIMKGIDLILIYIQKGVAEYVAWSHGRGRRPTTGPEGKGPSWVAELVADHKGPRRDPPREPGDEEWAPEGRMPAEYEDGLDQSKGIMRAYVYGASREKLAEVRAKIAAPEAAESAPK
jgi:membrane protein implicated in regulation of membrane protease activity